MVSKMEVDVKTMGRIGMAALAATCVAGMVACHRTREFADAQLTRLLRTQTASADDPRAPLDGSAVDCLRAWSGDADLAKNLPPMALEDAAKKTCRPKIDGWLADATRNPDKIAFDDLIVPATVRQATALLNQHRATVNLPGAMNRPPAALMPPQAMPAPAADPNAPADLNAATAAVDDLDSLCREANKAAASGQAVPIARYANFCEKRVEQLRRRIATLQTSDNVNPKEVQMLTQNAQRMVAVGRRLSSPPPTTSPHNQ
jgi:hypothetical protein